MFERFTDGARRSIFFGRYEASQFGTSSIDTEQLLLGLLREDHSFANELPSGAVATIRQRMEELYPRQQKTATSVDLPISDGLKRALMLAVEESEAFGHRVIDTRHLVLGLLGVEGCAVGDLLRKYGIEYAPYREVVRKMTFYGEAPLEAGHV